MKCKRSDCFTCPYPDCINDSFASHYRPSKERLAKQSAKAAETAKKRACVRCVESESRVLATEHAQNAQRGSAGPRMLPTTATERHPESLWMVSHSVRSAAKILLHTVTQSASDAWNSAAQRWIRHRHTTGSPWIPDLRGRFAPTTC